MDASATAIDLTDLSNEEVLEQTFVQFESYLRMTVRRQFSAAARAKFDSTDVVQSLWADLLDDARRNGRKFQSQEDLRRFLVRAARNRFIDNVRRNESAIRREEPMNPDDLHRFAARNPSTPSETVHAEDVWNKMLALCPPRHRELLSLRRQGLTSDEIARRTGLNDGSVRRIICDLARRMACVDQTLTENPDETSDG
ncbi:MAG: sigma-70 family RNA polymerase sigma factor [Planctomycetota bacterium]